MSFYDLSLHLVPTDEDVRSTEPAQLPKLERDVIDMALKAIAKALTRSEESVKERAKADKLKIAKLR